LLRLLAFQKVVQDVSGYARNSVVSAIGQQACRPLLTTGIGAAKRFRGTERDTGHANPENLLWRATTQPPLPARLSCRRMILLARL